MQPCRVKIGYIQGFRGDGREAEAGGEGEGGGREAAAVGAPLRAPVRGGFAAIMLLRFPPPDPLLNGFWGGAPTPCVLHDSIKPTGLVRREEQICLNPVWRVGCEVRSECERSEAGDRSPPLLFRNSQKIAKMARKAL